MQVHRDSVQIWEEEVTIPSYAIGEPNANPMFFENRVYQGSSGRVYPYPITETIGDTKRDTSYTALFLENSYLKIMVLPSLGGRIHRAYDKTTGQDFVYHNEVIKPALVGLLGPWISGGIEFNWPQHHRPTTFMDVDYKIRHNPDGSASILLNDSDRMYGTKAITLITLYPDKAYVEITGQLHNPTEFSQTFLWWANPAIVANEHTQSIFPPDVHAVMDHGKRDVSSFPIATGTYYKHDYSEGVDISRYKNIPVPTSYMAFHSDYDFVGSYDHEKETGILHVADHHISPGKKQWTWGCGDFGKAWDRNLTDTNGPYIELMTGVFTDNQPDFTYLMPGEEKTFNQYFFPYKQAPNVCNASKDLVLSLTERKHDKQRLSIYSTIQTKLTILVREGTENIYQETVELAPTEIFETELPSKQDDNLKLSITITDDLGKIVLSYVPNDTSKPHSIPEPAKAIPNPERLETIEELYMAAQHLQQYRHATFRSEPYYEEALRRDSKDYRCNSGYGELLLKRGLYQKSEQHFETAIERATKHNPNPQDSSAYTLLGLALFHQQKYEQAYNAFYKAIWDGKQQEMGFLYLGILEMRKEHWDQAARFLNQALIRNGHNLKVRGYLTITMRKSDQKEAAQHSISDSLLIDPFDLIAHYEDELVNMGPSTIGKRKSTDCITLAAVYSEAGLNHEAYQILSLCTEQTNPLLWYHLAYYAYALDMPKEAKQLLEKAENLDDSIYFPNTLADLRVLQSLQKKHVNLWKLSFMLGCFWYDKMEYDMALDAWETAFTHNPKHAKTLRCLSLVYHNQRGNRERAIWALEEACRQDTEDDRLLYELDQLYKKSGKDPKERIERLEQHLELVCKRDDLMVEYITLLNLLGHYSKARDLELSHSFHPWEGGEGQNHYTICFNPCRTGEGSTKQERYSKSKGALNAIS